jgi:hypothetical protein
VKCWPQVPLVIKPSAFACRAERLAWATSCPHRSIIRPSGKTQSKWPPSDPREEVALRVPHKLIWLDVFDTSFINYPVWYFTSLN